MLYFREIHFTLTADVGTCTILGLSLLVVLLESETDNTVKQGNLDDAREVRCGNVNKRNFVAAILDFWWPS